MITKQRITSIEQAIKSSRTAYPDLADKLPTVPGLYAFFVDSQEALSRTVVQAHLLTASLYAGKSESSLKKRDFDTHFAEGKSGSSTVRRSFGALLRQQLGLLPMRRGYTGKDQDFQNYKFDDKSETLLSEWMRSSLSVGWWPFDASLSILKDLETELIQHLNPPLNLQHSRHPTVELIKELRKVCAGLAKASSARL